MSANDKCNQGEAWGSRFGVILAVAGSAVGLGNFLRFPGQVAANGGGAFMVPYFICFILVGIPICWAEWTMGRYGGRHGFNSVPGIFSVLWQHPLSKYFGALGLLIPIVIYMYYVYIESWCLAYAWYYLNGELDLGRNPAVYGAFFSQFTGMEAHGSVFKDGIKPVFWFFCITFLINFYFIYRGLTRGIETFCKYAIPLLIIAAVVVAFRVLTLPEQPIPKPWQTVLPTVINQDQWQAIQQLAMNPQTRPAELKQQVENSIADYLAHQLKSADTQITQENVLVPPAGFAKTEAAYALAMAEIRSGQQSNAYRIWLEKAKDELDQETKLALRALEKEVLQADKSNSVEHQEKIHRQRLIYFSKLTLDSVDQLAANLALVNGAERFGHFKALVLRSVALEVAELPRNVSNGLGYMWNPDFEKLKDPAVWLAAAGQIFFSLSVGFGVILTYASYLKRDDDVVLSGLTASVTNEFCEVCLGGLVAIPATFIFLGTALTMEAVAGSTFGLGFNTLPTVFAGMPDGRWYGALWFMLLFLAAITSSLSMLQPAIAFLEEGFGLKRRSSVAALGLMTLSGALLVVYFSGNAVALSTMDDWIGTVGIFLLATIEVIIFAWILGVDKGMDEANRGSDLLIPKAFRFVFKYITPAFLLVILGSWLVQSLPAKIEAVRSQPEALLIVLYLVISLIFLVLMVSLAGENWHRKAIHEQEEV
ncbi:hypothetical protein [Methylicorpusculum sp.]|uniref:hypothetical protein n=1 Tax=Methylicorpusculum sp. TaxID=2713644 RepID=UPI002731A2B3|nr:hypothetical protein [Methylicorpusculum sp.]MDP2180684.1 hypothetical protein [Methylicorpusculum sp.]MDP3529260.1 hypothetical protein [Methylicorpusculum sp.]MDZ4153135.1 hypothetical protein [Methylicorpusculum sp.]